MDPSALHDELSGLVPEVLCPARGTRPREGARDEGPALDRRSVLDLRAVEAHVGAGCSRCARALVNARDAAVTLAAEAPAAVPRAALRERILAAARGGALAGRQGVKPRRFFDAAGELARLHIGAPGDAERTREVDDLAIGSPPGDDLCGRFLAQIQALTGFPLLFVSVLRGDRCGYRAQIGLDGQSRERRRETTFCTHTVSTGEPMVVPDAAAEPFFRGSNMVLREGIQSYVGVPLRTTRGIAVGNVCAMDHAPRRIGPEVIRVFELYAGPIVAEIERRASGGWPRSGGGAPVHPEAWFREMLAVAPGALAGATPPALLVASGPGAEALADLALPGEAVGQVSERTPESPLALGLLLPGGPAGEARRAELQAALRGGPSVEVVRLPLAR